MKHIYTSIIFFFVLQLFFGQCPSNTVIYLSDQQDVEDFVLNYPSCSEVTYSISISGSVSDLTSLNNITSVGGNIIINNTNSLTSLDGLQNIVSIGQSLIISYNDVLNDFTALNNIQQISGYLDINHMNFINEIDFLNNLTIIGDYLVIENNQLLQGITGLNSLTTIGDYISITRNDNLESVNGFNSLSSVFNYIEIFDNDVISEITGFNNLSSINFDLNFYSNNLLETISGFGNLQTIGGNFSIRDNSSLLGINDFQSLEIINGDLELDNNPNLSNFNAFTSLNQINNNLIVKDNSSLTDFSNFISLINIGGYFSVVNNDLLINFDGLQNLQLISGSLVCSQNDNLLNFVGLNNLSSIDGGLSVIYNDSLINFDGLNSLQSTSSLYVNYNDNLLNLNALNSLEEVTGNLSIGALNFGSSHNSLVSFPFNSLQIVEGNLIISGAANLIDISGFNTLEIVNGYINIDVNHAMTSISGFVVLTSVGDGTNSRGVEIRFNQNLSQITGFNSLTIINDELSIFDNTALVSITGFENLVTVEDHFTIKDNDSLNDISGFSSLTTINGDFQLGNDNSGPHSNLANLNGLEALQTITGDFSIVSNPSLQNVDALSSLHTIGGTLLVDGNPPNNNSPGNSSLESLNFSALTNISNIDIKHNEALNSLSFPNLQIINGYVYFWLNPVLINFVDFNNLATILGTLTIDNNESLSSLQGLNSLQEVGSLRIINSDNLTDLNDLESLQTIYSSYPNQSNDGYIRGIFQLSGNEQIASLNGLNSLNNVGYEIRIEQNSSLIDISSISDVNFQTIDFLSIRNNPSLSICNNQMVCNYLSINDNGYSISNNEVGCDTKEEILQNCTNALNIVTGNIHYNINQNNCTTNGDFVDHIMISADNGSLIRSAFSEVNGAYSIYTNDGDYSVSIASQLPMYFVANPSIQDISFSGFGNTEVVDFCIEPSGVFNDLNVTIYPSFNEPRPGFNTTYQLVYNNIGTTQLSGSVSFGFDDTKLQFLNASETISSQTSNTLTFDYSDLNPFETRTIDLEFNVFGPPTTEIDDELVAIATINPVLGDETEDDNVFELQQTVIGSYDPNDITVLEGEQILIEDADKYLHYLIRFQNTGTASAINVRVENVLDDKLDWATMQLESLSHTGRVEILNGSDVSFIFNNINLPDSTNDEPNSHGYIAYKIKPKDDVVLGDVFFSTADIYFDFNPPIITNTATTEIVEDQLSISDFENNLFSVFPNPTNSKLIIQSKVGLNKISVIDVNGRLLKIINNLDLSQDVTLDVENLSGGIYFLNIQAENGEQVIRFIKN